MTQRPTSQLPYDHTDQKAILERAKASIGLTISQIMAKGMPIARSHNRRDKGSVGNIIQEAWFGIPPNSSPDPDFKIAGIELKIIPLEKTVRGVRIKERTKVCSINYEKLDLEEWGSSSAKKKLNKILFIYYLYDATNILSSCIQHIELWIIDLDSNDIVIQTDWTRVRAHVRAGKAHKLSETMSMILAASRSGQGGGRDLVAQPHSSVLANTRAFSLKQSFTNQRWSEIAKGVVYQSIEEVLPGVEPNDFESRIMSGLSQISGRKLSEVSKALNIPMAFGKNAAATLVKKALGFKNVNARVKEFDQYGLEVKTIPLRTGDNVLWEGISFPTMKLSEFLEEEWEESDLQQYLDYVLFIPIYRPDRKTPIGSRVIGKPFFWRPTIDQWRTIEDEWRIYQEQVTKGMAKTTQVVRGGKIYEVTLLAKESETNIIHMRPHAKNRSDRDVDRMGNSVVKQSFWLNKRLVRDLVERSLDTTEASE